MIVWCSLLIILGVFGIMQDAGVITSFGASYRILTWITMLIALGILVRIRYKEKAADREQMRSRIEELQMKIREMEHRT